MTVAPQKAPPREQVNINKGGMGERKKYFASAYERESHEHCFGMLWYHKGKRK